MISRQVILLLTAVVFLAGCGKSSSTISQENLTKIGLALHEHHDAVQSFPCADRREGKQPAETRVGLSWRVHLLPYLGQRVLYQKFNFDEAWDGPNNSKLIAEMPAVFRSADAKNPGETSFHVLLSPDPNKRFLFNNPQFFDKMTAGQFGGMAVGMSGVTDGTSNTIMVVEAGSSTAQPWTKPGGLVVNLEHPKEVLAQPRDSVLMLIADGHVRSVSQQKVTDDAMLALLTRNGNERIVQRNSNISVGKPYLEEQPQKPVVPFEIPSLAVSKRTDPIVARSVRPEKSRDLELPVSTAPGKSLPWKQIQSEGMKATVLDLEGKDIVADMIWSPQGDAFFTLSTRGVLSRITTEDLVKQKQLNLGRGSSFLALSGQGLLVAVTDLQEVWIIDPLDLEVTGRIPVLSVVRVLSGPTLNMALAIGKSEGIRHGSVTVLDLIKKQPVHLYAIHSQDARITPDGKYYFARGGIEQLMSYKIEGFDFKPHQASDRIAQNGQTVCVSSDSKYVCLPSAGGNYGASYATNIYAVNNLIKPEFTIDSGHYPRVLGFDPAGGKIFAQNYDFPLLVYSMAGDKLHEFKLGRHEDSRQLVPHPQGNKLLVLTSQLFFVELDKRN